ncbi:MAG: hypothetical protein ACI9XZ_004283, partial [Alphaproteobacteria bacterium]
QLIGELQPEPQFVPCMAASEGAAVVIGAP